MTSLFEAFEMRATAVSAEVHRFATRREALDFVLAFLGEQRPGAVWANSRFLNATERDELSQQIAGLSFDVTREAAAAASVGISEIEWAISDTGTLVTDAGPVERRLASTLPEIHIALVPTSGIEPDMSAVFTHIHPRQSGYISMITGPSRTADIERVLTIGVHGPKRLIIVFVDELENQP